MSRATSFYPFCGKAPERSGALLFLRAGLPCWLQPAAPPPRLGLCSQDQQGETAIAIHFAHAVTASPGWAQRSQGSGEEGSHTPLPESFCHDLDGNGTQSRARPRTTEHAPAGGSKEAFLALRDVEATERESSGGRCMNARAEVGWEICMARISGAGARCRRAAYLLGGAPGMRAGTRPRFPLGGGVEPALYQQSIVGQSRRDTGPAGSARDAGQATTIGELAVRAPR